MGNGYNFYDFLADCVVTVHLGYMAYVVFGQLLIMIGWALKWGWIRNPWFRVSHLAMILIVAFEALVQYPCPLTTWEYQLREASGKVVDGDDGYLDVEDASFAAQLIRKIMFPGADFVPYLKPAYYTFALMVLASMLMAPPRFRRAALRAASPGPEPPTSSPSATAVMPTTPDPTGKP